MGHIWLTLYRTIIGLSSTMSTLRKGVKDLNSTIKKKKKQRLATSNISRSDGKNKLRVVF